MQIVVTFDSIEEFDAFRGKPAPVSNDTVQSGYIAPVEPDEEVPTTTTSASTVDAAEETAEKLKEDAQEKAVSEEFRVEVRKTLAKLNKLTGTNTASELIQSFGCKKLTDVALADLPALMEQAKEALNAAG